MAAPAYAEARDRFGRSALRFVARELVPLSADDLEYLADVVHTADTFLAETSREPDPLPEDLADLVAQVGALRSRVARVLAVAGLDASWATNPQRITLTRADSAVVVGLLLNPPPANETLRIAAEDYKAFAGL